MAVALAVVLAVAIVLAVVLAMVVGVVLGVVVAAAVAVAVAAAAAVSFSVGCYVTTSARLCWVTLHAIIHLSRSFCPISFGNQLTTRRCIAQVDGHLRRHISALHVLDVTRFAFGAIGLP